MTKPSAAFLGSGHFAARCLELISGRLRPEWVLTTARRRTRSCAAQHPRLGACAEARRPSVHDGAPLRGRGARRMDKGERAGRPARHRLRTHNQGAGAHCGEVRLSQHPPLKIAGIPRLRSAPARPDGRSHEHGRLHIPPRCRYGLRPYTRAAGAGDRA